MCGIVAVISKSEVKLTFEHEDIFKQLLFIDTLRGQDATGFFGIDKNKLIQDKKAIPGYHYVNNYFDSKIAKHSFHALVGHNRKATSKFLEDKHAHPFTYGDIILVHNGTLTEFDKTFDIDSEALTFKLSQEKVIDDIIDSVRDIEGAYALIWHNKKENRIYITRNYQRPLHYLETKLNYYIASEKEMLEFILKRNKISLGENKIEEFSAMKLFYLDLNKKEVDQKFIIKDIPYKTYNYNNGYYPNYNYVENKYEDDFNKYINLTEIFKINEIQPPTPNTKVYMIQGFFPNLNARCKVYFYNDEYTEEELQKILKANYLTGKIQNFFYKYQNKEKEEWFMLKSKSLEVPEGPIVTLTGEVIWDGNLEDVPDKCSDCEKPTIDYNKNKYVTDKLGTIQKCICGKCYKKSKSKFNILQLSYNKKDNDFSDSECDSYLGVI